MTIWQDNFDDNYLDPAKWEKGSHGGTGDVYERNQRLELEVYDGWRWVVSRDRYDLTKGKITIYLAIGKLYFIQLRISTQKSTTYEYVDDYYTIFLDQYLGKCGVTRKRLGEDPVLLYAGDWSASSNLFKIEIEAGIIRIWEGANCRAWEPYALTSYEVYIYILGHGYGVLSGIGWADDFYCEYCGTAEEKVEAKTELIQWQISEWLRANWVPLSVIGVVLAIVFAIIMGLI